MPAGRYYFPFSIRFCGYYEGFNYGGLNSKTWLLHRSKFKNDPEARGRIIDEMAAKAKRLSFDVMTYAPRGCGRDRSKIDHARSLAMEIARTVGASVYPAAKLSGYDLRRIRVLLIDDVLDSGATMKKLWFTLAESGPKAVGLVYLKSRW